MNSPTPTGLNRSRVDTRFKLSKYCPRTEPAIENCGSPTLRFGELLDFSLSFWPRHSAAWPAAFQITIKNNAKFSFLQLQRDVFSKRFQGSTVCHLNDNGECSFLDRLGQSRRLGIGSCRQFLCCVMVAALSVCSAIAPNRCRCTQLAVRCRNWFSASAAAKIGQAEIATMMAKSSASITNSQLFSLAK
jgi:hypothetical protein